MGNKLERAKAEPALAPSTALGRALHSFEHKSGKMLVAAVKKNSKEAVDEAVEFARKEYLKPRRAGVGNSTSFEECNAGLVSYLSDVKDVGDGPLFTQTPLYFAKKIGSNVAAKAIRDHLEKLSSAANGKDEHKGRVLNGVGEVNASRAELAKERLKAFQKKKEGE